MELRERLIQQRKARGLSQEELAAQLGVSRQAISKWETGDALPDLPKFMTLATVLGMSMDELCGREAAAGPSPEKETAPQKVPITRRVAGVVLLVLLLAGSFFAGTQFGGKPKSEADSVPALPRVFSVSGVQFSFTDGALSYEFVPSAGQPYTYEITFNGSNGSPQVFAAPYSGGVCIDTIRTLREYDSYSVTAVVSNGEDFYAVSIATDLVLDGQSNSVRWIPAQ